MPEREPTKRRPDGRPKTDILREKVSRSAAIPAPSGPAITFRGEKVTNGQILRLWREGQSQRQHSRTRIQLVRALRRMEPSSLIQLAARWSRRNPEAAEWVTEVLEQRKTLDRDLIANAGVVEPEFSREALGFTVGDDERAAAFASYLEEWRLRSVPTQTMFGKAVEDGEFGLTVIPSADDMDGRPDFYEYITKRAYEKMDDLAKSDYEPDEMDTRKRYVKVKDGKKQIAKKYDKGDDDKSTKAHSEALERYLLHCSAATVRVIPALDCAAILVRGKGRARWECVALIERTLYYVSELQEEEYGWQGLGDRKLVPLAYEANGNRMSISDGEIGAANQLYLYTAYLLCRDEDGRKHPAIFSTVGGAATWDVSSGDEDDPESVTCIDLYERYALPDGSCPALDGVKLWSYHGGLHSEDDNPDFYWEPYLWTEYHRIRAIEGNKTSINAATSTNAFPGYIYEPDSDLVLAESEAVIENNSELIVPEIPRTGEMVASAGKMQPFIASTVTRDAWQAYAADLASLQAATMDQASSSPDASGSSQVTRSVLAQTGKRHVREGVLEAVVSAGEKQTRVWHAIYQKHGIRWPIQTTQERPVRYEMREGRAPLSYDPDWVGDGHFNLTAAYPEESNPVAVDMERSLKKDKLSTTERVLLKNGIPKQQIDNIRVEMLKDDLREHPAYLDATMLRIGQKRGDKDLVDVIKQLQAQQKMSPAGLPGAPNGVPLSALNRPGESGGGGRQATASQIRGGEMAGQMAAAQAQMQAQAAPLQGAA